MTQRQLNFAQEYVVCGNASEAYRRVYPRSKGWKPANVETRACRQLAKVLPRVEELRAKVQTAKVATKAQALEKVSSLLEHEDARVVIAATERLAKMQGWDAAAKTELIDGTEMAAVQAILDSLTPEERREWLARATQ